MRTVRRDKRTCRNLCRFRRQYTATSSAASAARWGTQSNGNEHDECKKDHQGTGNADTSDEESASRAGVLPQGRGWGTNRRISCWISALGTKRRIIRQLDGTMCTVHVGNEIGDWQRIVPHYNRFPAEPQSQNCTKSNPILAGNGSPPTIFSKIPYFSLFFSIFSTEPIDKTRF